MGRIIICSEPFSEICFSRSLHTEGPWSWICAKDMEEVIPEGSLLKVSATTVIDDLYHVVEPIIWP